MRTITADSARTAENDDLLTTGEAAKILGTSRQHVVDLCDRGDLPFVTAGRHRRVRRADLETLRTRTQRMTRDQRRSLWLNHAVAGKLVAEPDQVIERAHRNLEAMRTSGVRGQAVHWLDEWQRLLDGPIAGVLVALTSTSPKSRELRQNAPFAGVLTEAERERVLESFVAHDGRQ